MRASQSSKNPVSAGVTTSIEAGAAENLRYIRSTIEAANTFTTVSAKGCLAMGLTGLAAAVLEFVPGAADHWLTIWLTAAVASCAAALYFMETKARAQGLSLRRAVAAKFFLTVAPAFVAGAILTAALHDSVGRDVIAAIWLLNYGAGLVACGVFSIPVVMIAGGAFMGLGTITFVAPATWAPVFLGLGFGGIHLLLAVVIFREHGG